MNAVLKQEIQKRQEIQPPYQYRECGLDNVWLQGGVEVIESPYGKSVKVHDVDGLHKCIANCLIRKTGALTGAEFKFLRMELDLSQATMGLLCGREDRTVRDWEGRDLVEDPANLIIRFVYQQRFLNPSAQFEDVAKKIRQLQVLDKKIHEMKLGMTESGWKAEECTLAA